jgi:hypothetical protein
MCFKKTRMKYLRNYWSTEWDLFANHLYMSEDQEDNYLSEKMNEFNQPLVNKFLRLYLERCVLIHSLAFFQFRKTITQGDNLTELKKIYYDR